MSVIVYETMLGPDRRLTIRLDGLDPTLAQNPFIAQAIQDRCWPLVQQERATARPLDEIERRLLTLLPPLCRAVIDAEQHDPRAVLAATLDESDPALATTLAEIDRLPGPAQ